MIPAYGSINADEVVYPLSSKFHSVNLAAPMQERAPVPDRYFDGGDVANYRLRPRLHTQGIVDNRAPDPNPGPVDMADFFRGGRGYLGG